MREIHCSALPRVWNCPASAAEPTTTQPDSPEARLGSAVHAVLAEQYDIGGAAKHWRVEASDVAWLAHNGQRMMERYLASMTVIGRERSMAAAIDAETQLSGTVDVLGSRTPAEAVILDYKSGYVERDYRAQTLGYAYLAMEDNHQIVKAYLVVLWLRDMVADVEAVTRDEVMAWAEELKAHVADRLRYTSDVGNCTFCPLATTCAMRPQLLRQAVALFADPFITDLTAGKLAELYPQAQALDKALAAYRAALRQTLRDSGPCDLGNGMEIYLAPGERRTLYLTPGAIDDVLMPALDVDSLPDLLVALDGAVTIDKTKLGKAVAAKAERGQKGKLRAAVLEQLETVGAVQRTGYERTTVRKKPVAALETKGDPDGE